MAILIREYLGSPTGLNESSLSAFSLNEGMNTLEAVSKDSLMVDIEGIHVGPTRNFTWYTEEALKSSVPTWTKPYQRPLILHHNEKDGKIIGRVMAANYTDMNTRSKTGALVFTCNVPDREGKDGIKDGRLKTVSIGVIAHDVRCSICGHVISEYGECEHERGMIYDDEVCYWMVHKMEAKELSYVIVPSDIYAHNIKIYSPDEKNLIENFKQEGVTGVSKVTSLQESTETIIVEDADKKVETKVVDAKVNDGKQEESKADDVDSLKATIAKLEELTDELKAEVARVKKEAERATELKEAAEGELVVANTQLKEFAVEQVIMLREQLGRSPLLKENLMKRTQDSIMDSIADLKEEVLCTAINSVNLAESTEESEEVEAKGAGVDMAESHDSEQQDPTVELAQIEKPLAESLVDGDKDSSRKTEDKRQNNFGLDVKESEEISNSDYETTLAMAYYNL